jgi:hypothetical protein
MMTKLLEVEASALAPSPVTPSFFSNNGSAQRLVENAEDMAFPTEGSTVAMAGLGIGSIEWTEGLSANKTDGGETSMTTSTSEGTYNSHGVQTPENGQNHPLSHHLLMTPSEEVRTPLASPNAMYPHIKSPDLRAFEDMLGKFPQQEKALLHGISARVVGTKTPVPDGP